MANRYAPIGDYGVIGDLYTVALVGMDGSIDFLCLPHFDSPSVFAALVDAERGGRFQIAPILEGAARKQLYLPDTNVLLTRFLDADGVAELSDFMPVEDVGQANNLVRRAKTVRGEVRFQTRYEPRSDYARATHTAKRRPSAQPDYSSDAFKRAVTSGAAGSAQHLPGRWREMVNRSALTVKLLTSRQHGSGATGTIATPGFATRRSGSTG